MASGSPRSPRELGFWEPLPQRTHNQFSIRLLTVYPGAGHSQIKSKLEVVLRHQSGHVQGRKDQPYEAISYCCGNQRIQEEIECNDVPLRIGRNLCNALKAFRDSYQERVLWVDEICINQSDLQEKAAQVNLLGFIYPLARSVLVHLGTGANGEAGAFKLFKEIELECETTAASGAQYEVELNKIMERIKNNAVLRTTIQKKLNAVRQLMILPYWERVWPIQEVALAQEISFHCGGDSLPLKPILLGLYFAVHYVQFDETQKYQSKHGEGLDHTKHLRATTREHLHSYTLLFNHKYPGRGATIGTISQLFNIVRWQESKLEVDKVYAVASLLGCASEAVSMQPDYTLSANEAFTEVAFKTVQSMGSLDFISLAPSRRPGLPSWVPDWRPAHGETSP